MKALKTRMIRGRYTNHRCGQLEKVYSSELKVLWICFNFNLCVFVCSAYVHATIVAASWKKCTQVSLKFYGFVLISICVCLYVCVCIYIYLCAYIYIYTYMHAYMHTCQSGPNRNAGKIAWRGIWEIINAYILTCIHTYIHAKQAVWIGAREKERGVGSGRSGGICGRETPEPSGPGWHCISLSMHCLCVYVCVHAKFDCAKQMWMAICVYVCVICIMEAFVAELLPSPEVLGDNILQSWVMAYWGPKWWHWVCLSVHMCLCTNFIRDKRMRMAIFRSFEFCCGQLGRTALSCTAKLFNDISTACNGRDSVVN
jgi:hypothetical protein